MKIGWWLGLVFAILLHAAVLAFGGLLFAKQKNEAGSIQPVDLLSDVDTEDAKDKKDKKTPEEQKEEKKDELETEKEKPPDATEIVRSLEAPPIDNTPALEAASLSAIEAALNGQGGGGDFFEALTFASGGRIGGTGKVGASNDAMESAFNLSEIDQKPRAIYQESPVVPTEMHGKKIEGAVTIIFVVNAAGKVEDPRVEKSSHTAFEAPALSAVRKWKFDPGVRAGQRVASKMRVTIRFPRS